MAWRLKGCGACGGDLTQEDDAWRCWQCGRYRYTDIHRPQHRWEELRKQHRKQASAVFRVTRAHAGLAGANINGILRLRELRERRWWNRNRQVIDYLDEGRTVREISTLTHRGARQIRVVRERLTDIRAADRD